MKRRKLRDIVIPFCEGEAEVNLFGFLKGEYSNKVIDFGKQVNLGGFSDFNGFKKKYDKGIREQDLKPKREFASVTFLFLIDGDLEDSQKIKDFLVSEGHLVQLCEPNTEGLILRLVNKPQTQTVGDKDFRKKCKTEFFRHFACEAHKLKDKILKQVFNSADTVKKHLPTLHDLFNK